MTIANNLTRKWRTLMDPSLRTRLIAVAICAFGLTACAAQEPSGDSTVATAAIENVTIIDVETGERLEDQTVLVRENRISAIAPADTVTVPLDARRIDGQGKFLIPGLWQMHGHSLEHYGIDYGDRMAPFQLYIANGVTGLRDMGSSLEQLVVGKQRLRELGVASPRVVAAGPLIEGPQAPNPRMAAMVIGVDSPEEGRLLVDALALTGLDLMKIHGDMSPETYHAMAERANSKDLPFAGHVPAGVSVLEASDAGQVSIEHLGYVRDACVVQGNRDLDVPKCEGVLEHLRANGTFWGPTLLGALPVTADHPYISDERWRYVKASKRATFQTFPEEVTPEAQAAYALAQQLVGMAADIGVRLIASTDASGGTRLPGFSAVDELVLFVEAGLSPLNALQAGTLNPALLLGMEDSLGTVSVGRLADLVLLDGDPLIDIENLRRVDTVIADGRVFDAQAIQALFEDVFADASEPN
jgi:imidazolonepropionase-like amidohydrolase